jgi:hypothetical protein
LADKTYLDELVEYPVIALHRIGSDKVVAQLLTNNPDIDMESGEADAIYDRYLFDYNYVDGAVNEAAAFICVEAELTSPTSHTMVDFKLYVTIVCHKSFMDIDVTKFKGIIGNRRENLVRRVDKLLNDSVMFGIGQLTLDSARTVSAPAGFVARELAYRVSDFKDKGVR